MSKNILVAVFSASGVTTAVGKEIARIADADFFEIVPKEIYTADDLNWMNKKSRSSVEMNDPSARPEIADTVSDMASYDKVIVGFPIWWGVAPRIIDTFLDVHGDVKWEKGIQINYPNEDEIKKWLGKVL